MKELAGSTIKVVLPAHLMNPAVAEIAKRTLRKTMFSLEPVETSRNGRLNFPSLWFYNRKLQGIFR